MTETELLPIAITVRGEVVSSNFPDFAEMVRIRLGEINRDLKTDDDFDQADKDSKAIASAESALKAAKEKALSDAEQLHALFGLMDDLTGDLAKARLDLTNQIKKRKEEVKNELVEDALATFDIDPGLARRTYLTSLQNAIKGKRTLESMKTALRVTATTAQATIAKSREMIVRFGKTHGVEMVSDQRELELKSPDSVEAELRRRFDAKKAAEEKKVLEDQAAASKAEADKAKRDLAEASKPPAPPVNQPPSNVEQGPWNGGRSERMPAMAPAQNSPTASEPSPGASAADEWKDFKATCLAAFAPLKAAREGLKHTANIAKAQGFANSINQAWKEWT